MGYYRKSKNEFMNFLDKNIDIEDEFEKILKM